MRQVGDQLRTCLRPNSVVEFGFYKQATNVKHGAIVAACILIAYGAVIYGCYWLAVPVKNSSRQSAKDRQNNMSCLFRRVSAANDGRDQVRMHRK